MYLPHWSGTKSYSYHHTGYILQIQTVIPYHIMYTFTSCPVVLCMCSLFLPGDIKAYYILSSVLKGIFCKIYILAFCTGALNKYYLGVFTVYAIKEIEKL